ncbi:APC family permease [Varunaivibrio sulfuroxidans]|uniref:Amino acid:proton symporter (ABT family) n=1 Tax=Varunaivibrio sulfuroxidans TaxID=1773489 RepID=A0A4R3JBS4_9PROT|nr:APC family permease [Varunaivibrio sulfuroxidans]TCS63388.1 amino acid:proton symporter (ABT family) [Varunaivibrio sulfuroxidans]WES30465.1 APC family permease [Varunaivibrio sulfuroxidans]
MARKTDKIGFWSATAIGVGGMVGGGIFAVLGLSVQVTRAGAPLAFALAGGVALLSAYSYVKLSVTFPSEGGTVSYIDKAFGPGLFSGSANILLWLSYIIMLSLYAHAFGSYAAQLMPASQQVFWLHAYISLAVLTMTALNMGAVKIVGEAEDVIVVIKISILLVFVLIGALSIDPSRLAPSQWAAPLPLAAGGMLIFVAYEGFELIANTARDVRDPVRTLPRAFYAAVGFVIVLYIAVSAVAVGNLTIPQIIAARDFALAAAAQPFLGESGYMVITIAALLSTVSAINATLYGAARLSYVIAKDGELPRFLERKVWSRPVEGLLITCGATLLTANFFDIQSISTMGSTGFLLIFAIVNAAGFILAEKTGGRRWISALGGASCLAALASLIWRTATTTPSKLGILAAMIALAVGVEILYRLFVRKTNARV